MQLGEAARSRERVWNREICTFYYSFNTFKTTFIRQLLIALQDKYVCIARYEKIISINSERKKNKFLVVFLSSFKPWKVWSSHLLWVHLFIINWRLEIEMLLSILLCTNHFQLFCFPHNWLTPLDTYQVTVKMFQVFLISSSSSATILHWQTWCLPLQHQVTMIQCYCFVFVIVYSE